MMKLETNQIKLQQTTQQNSDLNLKNAELNDKVIFLNKEMNRLREHF